MSLSVCVCVCVCAVKRRTKTKAQGTSKGTQNGRAIKRKKWINATHPKKTVCSLLVQLPPSPAQLFPVEAIYIYPAHDAGSLQSHFGFTLSLFFGLFLFFVCLSPSHLCLHPRDEHHSIWKGNRDIVPLVLSILLYPNPPLLPLNYHFLNFF